MTITTYHINNIMKSYFKQNRSIDQRSKKVQQTVSDTVRLSTAGRKRIFEKMKEDAIDRLKVYYGGK